MSSYAASCFICSRAALSASATSDSSRTAAEPHFCRSASACWNTPTRPRHRVVPSPVSSAIVCGVVPPVAEGCRSSNGSLPLSSCCAHHRLPSQLPHENHIPTRALPSCLGTHAASLSYLARRIDPSTRPLYSPAPDPASSHESLFATTPFRPQLPSIKSHIPPQLDTNPIASQGRLPSNRCN
jgi:hypothetical protein